MTSVSPRSRAVAKRAGEIRRGSGTEIRRLREDAGLSLSAVARASGVSLAHLWGIEAGTSEASTEVLVSIATALGADLSVRLYPTSGPRLRDHLQARMGETLLRAVHARWRRSLEVPVYRPARGVIDLVLHDPQENQVVSLELHSEIRRLEQQVRWAHQKADALPSSDLWRFLPPDPSVSSAIVLRNTQRNRQTVAAFAATLQAAFPGSCRAAVQALSGDQPWPGPAVLWIDLGSPGDRLLEQPPRGIVVGR